MGRRCWRSSRAIINTSGLVKAANNYNLSECCEVKTHLYEHAQQEWLLLWQLKSIYSSGKNEETAAKISISMIFTYL